ncbi:MAG TPA: peptidoglycan-associated lipoprotein Pal [Candidatus Binataceae bacterium]|nr:peptidoglycan-associated lipoprotein Pal [Candidatus Binataceae bacterium]
MIRIPRGRGGWVSNMGQGVRTAALVLAIIAFVGTGCSSKKNTSGEGQLSSATGPGMNGQNMPPSGSLPQYQKGELGANGSGGPLTDIHFGYNDYAIQPQDNAILRANADWLTQNPATHVQVEGHCDDRGSEEYNIALGAKRAQAAKDYLTTLGISSDRISTISYGKELPLCTDETEDCWAQNRRDHFAVSQAQ